MNSTWQKLSGFNIEELAETRKQIHQAVQLTALTGRAFLPKVEDDHFASLLWLEDKNLLAGQEWGKNKIKTAINFKDFTILFLDAENNIVGSFPLESKTFGEAFDWLKEQVNLLGEDVEKLSLDFPYEIPVYPTANSASFQFANKELFNELSKCFANTNLVLKYIKEENEQASSIVCWPHHFDIATLIVLNDSKENYKSIGVGFSPGDDNYNEPYFYITPWPYPNTDEVTLPELPSGGFWHTKGWVGAILTAKSILVFDSSEKQHSAVIDFLNNGIKAVKDML